MASRVRVAITVGALALVVGCQGAKGIRAITPTTFVAAAQYGSVNGSWARAREEAVRQANQFCASKGESAVIISERQSGALGFSPQKSDVTFSCGPAAAP